MKDAKRNERELYRAPEIARPHDQAKADAAFREQQKQDQKLAREAEAAARSQRQREQTREEFALWESAMKNALQGRHLAQRARLYDRHEQRQRHAEDRIEKAYGEYRRADEGRLAKLNERQSKGNRLSRAVDAMRGLDGEREALQKNLANIEQRSAEIRDPVENEYQAATILLDHQQTQERSTLESVLDHYRDSGYAMPDSLVRDIETGTFGRSSGDEGRAPDDGGRDRGSGFER